MLYSLLRSLYQRWHIRSLGAKLLVPSIGLMLLSLLGSTLAFVGGTSLTRNRLLEQQIATEAERVTKTLARRAETVANAASLLANDPSVVEAVGKDSEAALSALNSRAVVVRDRFGLAVIQIYDRDGQAHTNLMLSSLYRESSMLPLAEPGMPVARVVGDRLLLLSRAEMPDDGGTVVVGIDLETELQEILTTYRLSVDLGLGIRGVHVGTREGLPFGAPDGWVEGQYSQRLPVTLGRTPADLLLVRPTTDITRVTNTGLFVMVGSTLFTTLLLSGLNVMVIRSIARPIHRLSMAAEAVALGDLDQEVALSHHPLTIGDADEISLLARAFNDMVAELRGLYGSLEAKVKARTQELTTAAEVARAVSSSLELDVILRRSARLIQERLRFCHVGIYLIEHGSEMAVLKEAAGEAERGCQPQNAHIPSGSNSPVGIAVATGKPRVIQNVAVEPAHLKPPLLMDTCSTAAIPLLVGDATIGVLDVQSRRRDAFAPDTVSLLTTLADQIATGVHNARLYDQQRRTADHLAEVDRLKTQFLAVMSHELRTPLNTIIGFSKVLLKGIDGPINDRQEQDLSFIHKSGKHLLDLIKDILDISQINAGKTTLNLEEVDLRGLIESTLDAAGPLVEDKPVTLRANVDPDLPMVRADERRVRQIMLNLLSNAAKFTESGHISVQARVAEVLDVRAERMEPFVEVSVIDTGVGIPEDEMAHIFKEFTQVDASTTRRFDGTGLGLPITKKLVELHGGRIWAESAPDQGSTFTFLLPVNGANSESSEGAGFAATFDLEALKEVSYDHEMAT